MTAMERDKITESQERHIQASQEALAAMSEFESVLKKSEVKEDVDYRTLERRPV